MLGHVGQFGVARRNRSGGGRLMLVGILEYSPVNACVVSNRMPVEKPTRRECMASPWMDGVLPIVRQLVSVLRFLAHHDFRTTKQ
jgi:hypothetical protein